MDAKFYKFMFQNTNNALYHTGSLWNSSNNERFDFLYISELTKPRKKKYHIDKKLAYETHPLGLLVISNLSYKYLEFIAEMIQYRKIYRVVMPYMNERCRLLLLEKYSRGGQLSTNAQRLLRNPYSYLKDSGVEDIYMLWGNGPVCHAYNSYMGDYFVPVTGDAAAYVEQQDGIGVEAFRAGYMLYMGWYFCFGCYGDGLDATVVLYHGSIGDNPVLEDCVLNVRTLTSLHSCTSQILPETVSCDLRCDHRSDYDYLKRHNRSEVKEYMTGTLLLGNMKVPGQVEKIYSRFGNVKEKVRFVGVPNAAAEGYWDRRLLGLGKEYYKRYWVIPHSTLTQTNALMDISVASPYNNIQITDEYFGLCASGFLTNRSGDVYSDYDYL